MELPSLLAKKNYRRTFEAKPNQWGRKMIHTDEDDEFERIATENRLKSSGLSCCTYDCIQGRDCPVRKAEPELNIYEKAMGWRKRQMVICQIKKYEKTH
jgi:hypothetical protein